MYFHVTDGNQSDKGFAVYNTAHSVYWFKSHQLFQLYIYPFLFHWDVHILKEMIPLYLLQCFLLSGILTFHFIIVVKKIKIKNLCYYTERSSLPFCLWLHSLVVTPSHFCGCLSLPFLWMPVQGNQKPTCWYEAQRPTWPSTWSTGNGLSWTGYPLEPALFELGSGMVL